MASRDPLLIHSPLFEKRGPFTDGDYDPLGVMGEISSSNLLVIGAGGLGCEMLKDLAMSGFPKISVIDMDTIELSNLNRQFLFRMKDVGESKAIVAANFVKAKVPKCEITGYFNKIQDFDVSFYKQFTMVICGLDSIEARRWINSTLVTIGEEGQLIPMIDGGTEGFHGSIKVMIPTYTACFECYMDLVPEKVTYPLCTLASTPRLPEHCIEWAHQLQWGETYPHIDFDSDNMTHVDMMYKLSKARADEFGIEGVTKGKTLGVVKNIIPAIASTNAIISGGCCNEAFKFITDVNPVMNDMMFYNGEVGVVANTNNYQRKDNCPVCGTLRKELKVNGLDISLGDFVRLIKMEFHLDSPGLSYNGVDFYNMHFNIGADESTTPIGEMLPFKDGKLIGVVHVVDRKLTNTMKVTITID